MPDAPALSPPCPASMWRVGEVRRRAAEDAAERRRHDAVGEHVAIGIGAGERDRPRRVDGDGDVPRRGDRERVGSGSENGRSRREGGQAVSEKTRA